MAVKASAIITLTSVVDIKATYRYYLLQSSTLAKPAKPTTNPPSSSWKGAEPSYISGSTNSLYYVDLTVFSNGTFSYSDVSLSTSYEAAKEAFNKAAATQNNLDKLNVGGRNLWTDGNYASQTAGETFNVNTWSNTATASYSDDIPAGYTGLSEYRNCTATDGGGNYHDRSPVYLENGVEYTYSFFGKCVTDGEITHNRYLMGLNGPDGENVYYGLATNSYVLTNEWKRYTHTFVMDGPSGYYNRRSIIYNVSETYLFGFKLEKGNKATDWSPAPEDIDAGITDAKESADTAQSTANANTVRINNATMSIDSINAAISTLVTGKNGESLMTQTDSGWTFSLASILDTLNNVTSAVDDLDSAQADTNNIIDNINQSIADLGEYTEYIKFGIDNGKPCIILGETDSNFKVKITNTAIQFMEGAITPASISNQKLLIENAEVRGELQQTNDESDSIWTWNTRSNGNYCLMWKRKEEV